ncbi:MAG: serine/threonine-protein kinase [Polyangiales bacterium]
MPSVFPPGARLGLHYRVARLVAHGPIAAVYEAHDLDSGQTVAFKWLHAPDDHHATLSRLTDRAREAQRLRHAQLVEVLDVAREDDSLFVVSRWEGGEPYSHLLAQHLMPFSQRLDALALAFGALDAGHRAGLAHAGLHPDNLYVCTRDGVSVKLLDLALNQTCGAAMFGLPQQVAAGHHVFMAPEQLEPSYTPNVRSDVFAAAVLVFQALTGRLPFVAPDVQSLRGQFTHEPPRVDILRSDVPHSLASLIAACLARRPEHRPSNLDALRAELSEFAREAVTQPARIASAELPPVSATQSLARGELIVTPRDAREPERELEDELEDESVSQPISLHGEQVLTPRWNQWILAALVTGAALFTLVGYLLPAPRPPAALPPSLPVAAPAINVEQLDEPSRPDAARPTSVKPKPKHRTRHKDERPADSHRAGRPLSRDDF